MNWTITKKENTRVPNKTKNNCIYIKTPFWTINKYMFTKGAILCSRFLYQLFLCILFNVYRLILIYATHSNVLKTTSYSAVRELYMNKLNCNHIYLYIIHVISFAQKKIISFHFISFFLFFFYFLWYIKQQYCVKVYLFVCVCFFCAFNSSCMSLLLISHDYSYKNCNQRDNH